MVHLELLGDHRLKDRLRLHAAPQQPRTSGQTHSRRQHARRCERRVATERGGARGTASGGIHGAERARSHIATTAQYGGRACLLLVKVLAREKVGLALEVGLQPLDLEHLIGLLNLHRGQRLRELEVRVGCGGVEVVEPALQRLLDLPACNRNAHTACQPAANTRLSGMWSAVGGVVPRTGDTDTDRGLSPPPPSTAQANPTHTRPLRTPTHQPHCACAPCAIAASAVCCASPVAAAFERSAAWCTSSFSVTIA
jgi:hypothetical protein